MTSTDTESAMKPLWEIRKPLHDGLRLLPTAARAVDIGQGWQEALDAALDFTENSFIPACTAENFTLLGAVNGIFGSPEAANIAMHQHDSMKRMAEDLAKIAEAAEEANSVDEFRAPLLMLLYGLYGAGRVHVDSEETAYFGPIEDHLSESQIRVLTDNLGRITEGQTPARLAAADRGHSERQ